MISLFLSLFFLPFGVAPWVPVGHVRESPVQEYRLKRNRKREKKMCLNSVLTYLWRSSSECGSKKRKHSQQSSSSCEGTYRFVLALETNRFILGIMHHLEMDNSCTAHTEITQNIKKYIQTMKQGWTTCPKFMSLTFTAKYFGYRKQKFTFLRQSSFNAIFSPNFVILWLIFSQKVAILQK